MTTHPATPPATNTLRANGITSRADLVSKIDAATGGRLPVDALDTLVAIAASLWDSGYHAGIMDEFKGQPEATSNPITADNAADMADTARLFANGNDNDNTGRP